MVFLLAILLTAFVLALGFFVIAGIVWLICWGFSLTFSWPVVIAVWAICVLLRWIVSAAKPKE